MQFCTPFTATTHRQLPTPPTGIINCITQHTCVPSVKGLYFTLSIDSYLLCIVQILFPFKLIDWLDWKDRFYTFWHSMWVGGVQEKGWCELIFSMGCVSCCCVTLSFWKSFRCKLNWICWLFATRLNYTAHQSYRAKKWLHSLLFSTLNKSWVVLMCCNFFSLFKPFKSHIPAGWHVLLVLFHL